MDSLLAGLRGHPGLLAELTDEPPTEWHAGHRAYYLNGGLDTDLADRPRMVAGAQEQGAQQPTMVGW